MGTGPERGDGLEHRSGDDAADGGPVRELVAEQIAEQMVEQAQNFDLYDLAPLGCCAVSEAGEIMHADGTAAALFGVSRSALVGQPIFRFIAADDAPAFAGGHQQLDLAADLGQVLLPRDALLQLDEPHIAFGDNLFGELVG